MRTRGVSEHRWRHYQTSIRSEFLLATHGPLVRHPQHVLQAKRLDCPPQDRRGTLERDLGNARKQLDKLRDAARVSERQSAAINHNAATCVGEAFVQQGTQDM
jgi:hypothetical protein